MSQFTDTLVEGWGALFSVDGVIGTIVPEGGQPADCQVILTENSTVVEVGESVQVYKFEAKVPVVDVDPVTAQGGALTVSGTTYYVVAVNQLNRVVSAFTLSDTPVHSQQ